MKRVLFHVGTPKTGTSFLQDVLFRQQDLLAEHGIHYFADRFDSHFLAALDLMEREWGGLEKDAVGAWDRLAGAVRGLEEGTAIISHEIFANATAEQAARALADLGLGDGVEIHLVLSARDLGRQIPAEWQESVKHRARMPYRAFLDELQAPERVGRAAWFWGVQELPAILQRWGARLPPERIHLVTVPPRGSTGDLLWSRFATTFGLDQVPDLDTARGRSNPSLGVPEAAFVRRLNGRLQGAYRPADYRAFVRERLCHQALAGRGSPGIVLPPEVHGWVDEVAARWITHLSEGGYDVVGGLQDLRPDFGSAEFIDPDTVSDQEFVEVAMDVVVELLDDRAAAQRRIDELVEDNRRLEIVAAKAEPITVGRVARAVVRRVRRVLPSRQQP